MTTYGVDVPAFVGVDPAGYYRRFATATEHAGFTRLWVGDHLLWRRPRYETFALLALLAGCTSLPLGTGVALAPLRPPHWLAKSAATVHDMASGGLILGLGIGGEYSREFELARVDPADRTGLLEEAVAHCRAAWRGDLGDDHSPRPWRPLPIWLGGRKDATLSRVARLGDGWLGLFLSPQRFATRVSRLEELCAAAGRPAACSAITLWTCVDDNPTRARDLAAAAVTHEYGLPPSAFQRYLVTGTPQDVADQLASYAAAGADHIEIHFACPDLQRQLERWAASVSPALHT